VVGAAPEAIVGASSGKLPRGTLKVPSISFDPYPWIAGALGLLALVGLILLGRRRRPESQD
jgi:MYXO-CTERM domain-containing protein